ncbi:MAG TPA: hypothetical protein VFZ27_00905 [Terriglobia bacterium]|nr:hypothetical protein [Terriglobia bacterium]
MPKQHHIGDLESPEGLRFHRRQWSFERIGWIALGLFVLLALAGLFGMGPASHARAASADGRLRVEYERFARRQAPSELVLYFSPQAVRDGRLRFWISRDYLDEVGVQQIVPQPSSTDLGGEKIYFDFNIDPGSEYRAVTFELQPEQTSRLQANVGLDGGSEVRYWQFIYP